MTVWAFNKVTDEKARALVYESVKAGKSRFGWSQKNEHDLKLMDNWSDWHSRQLFLLQVQKGDWIVHVNTPVWGRCVAVQVTSDYSYDEGLDLGPEWGATGRDFRHCFDVDVATLVEFDRRDKNILPSVNLNPRKRYHRVYAGCDFLTSLGNIKENKVSLPDGESKEEYHLKDETEKFLKEITGSIHQMNKSKALERYLAKVFREIPGVVNVVENGFGWGTDFGADLIVETETVVGNLSFENKIVVQIKSFSGDHNDLEAVRQIKTAIEKYEATAGMIITTGKRTEILENKIQEVSNEKGCPIDLLAGEDVARFVIKHAGNLLFRLDATA